MGTFIVGLIVLCGVFFAVRSLIRDKKNGKSTHCGGDCRHCRGCH